MIVGGGHKVHAALHQNVCPLGRDIHLYILTAAVDGGIVHIHDVLTLLAVRLEGCVLHILDCVLYRDDAGDSEECALKDGVGASAKADFSGDLGCIDDVELDLLAADDGLCGVRNACEGLLLVPEGVEKEAAAFLDTLEHVIFLEV